MLCGLVLGAMAANTGKSPLRQRSTEGGLGNVSAQKPNQIFSVEKKKKKLEAALILLHDDGDIA